MNERSRRTDLAFRIYLITDRRLVGADASNGFRPLIERIERALAGAPRGAVAVQLREKDLAGGPLFDLASALRTVTADAGALLLVNDRVDVAMAARADGVHLPVAGLSPLDVRSLWPSALVGVSTHGAREVEVAAGADADFAVFGPIFDTPSKRAFGAPLGPAALARAVARAPSLPIYAVGGVTAGRAGEVRGVGATGVAVVSAVLAADDPAAAVRTILDALRPDSRA